MPSDEPPGTKGRILTEAMRLFGLKGYAATTIAQIEEAAGLSPGSGALYRHFRSKSQLLAEGITRLVERGEDLRALMSTGDAEDSPGGPPGTPDGPLGKEELLFVAHAGLARLEDERDLNRILMRDLKEFPGLLDMVRREEMSGNHEALAAWLAARSPDAAAGRDWSAVAAVVMDAVAHYWLFRDIFGGEHPTGVSRDRYLNALVDMVHAFSRGRDASGG